MRAPRITAAMLERAGACTDGLDAFRTMFPEGADVTVENAEKAAAAGLNLHWAAEALFTAAARDEYQKAIAPAWAEYEKATAPASAEYDKVTAAAWAEYQKAKAAAFVAAYDNGRGIK